MTRQEEATRFAESAPPLSQKELEAINTLFPAYIFRRSRTDELWTTCCHQHIELPPWPNQSADERFVMMVEHQREPKTRYQRVPEEDVKCPYCGRMTIVKELGRTGRRENLSRYRRAVVLRWDGEYLWARAYDCAKHYTVNYNYELTGYPTCHLLGVYRFKPGLAECTTRYYYTYAFTGIDRQDGPLTKGRWHIHSPFYANADYGMGYDVIGLDQVQQSPFRYCMAETFLEHSRYFLEFLEACCFYPRQIEMLMKAEMTEVVRDLAERGVKNALVINWNEENPAKAFGLNRQDMKTFLGTNRDVEILVLYKKLKGKVPIPQCAEWLRNGLNVRDTFRAAKEWSIPPEKLIRYLAEHVGCARFGGMPSIRAALHSWKDYLTAAQALGYQLHHENVLMPRPLGPAHDSATDRHRAILERERQEMQRQQDRLLKEKLEKKKAAYLERKTDLEKKYAFEMDGFLIRVPADGDEILAEGRKLQHCVGGYADRHLTGLTTILFMRKKTHPDEPWLTIEMDGNKLRQIHGFKNEGVHTAKGRFAPDPREVYKDFIDTWLDWLEKGSRRDKNGRPKLPKNKKGAAA